MSIITDIEKFNVKLITDSKSLATDLLGIAQLQTNAGAQADVQGIVTDLGTFGVPTIFAAQIEGVVNQTGPALVDGLTKYIDLCNKVLAALPAPAPAPPTPTPPPAT